MLCDYYSLTKAKLCLDDTALLIAPHWCAQSHSCDVIKIFLELSANDQRWQCAHILWGLHASAKQLPLRCMRYMLTNSFLCILHCRPPLQNINKTKKMTTPFICSVSAMYMCILGGYHQSGGDTRPMMTLGNKPRHAEPRSPLPVSPVLLRATRCPSCQAAHTVWKMESVRETLIKIALRVDRKHCFITHLPFLACCCTNVLHAAQPCITIG